MRGQLCASGLCSHGLRVHNTPTSAVCACTQDEPEVAATCEAIHTYTGIRTNKQKRNINTHTRRTDTRTHGGRYTHARTHTETHTHTHRHIHIHTHKRKRTYSDRRSNIHTHAETGTQMHTHKGNTHTHLVHAHRDGRTLQRIDGPFPVSASHREVTSLHWPQKRARRVQRTRFQTPVLDRSRPGARTTAQFSCLFLDLWFLISFFPAFFFSRFYCLGVGEVNSGV